ncbi:MAG: hypothetical protein LBE49_08735 [Deltaproteobacteria bacterium]|jgi:hypothetical protein|nr:hypothetical protein [Deltaproteobacteria bacterium]
MLNWRDNSFELIEVVRLAQSVLAAYNTALARSVKLVADALGLEYSFSRFSMPYIEFLTGPAPRPIWDVIEWGTIPYSDSLHVLRSEASKGGCGAIVAIQTAPEECMATMDVFRLGFLYRLGFEADLEDSTGKSLLKIFAFGSNDEKSLLDIDAALGCSGEILPSGFEAQASFVSSLSFKVLRGDLGGFLADPEAVVEALRPVLAPEKEGAPLGQASLKGLSPEPIAFDPSKMADPSAESVREAQRIMAEFAKTLGERLCEAANALSLRFLGWIPAASEGDAKGRKLANLSELAPWTISGWTSVPLSHSRHVFYLYQEELDPVLAGSLVSIEAAPDANLLKCVFPSVGPDGMVANPFPAPGGPALLRVSINKISFVRGRGYPSALSFSAPGTGPGAFSPGPFSDGLALDFDLLEFMADASYLVEALKPHLEIGRAVSMS